MRRLDLGVARCVGIQAVPAPAVSSRQQLLAVHDLESAVVADPPREIDPVADHVVWPRGARQRFAELRMLERRDRPVKRVGHSSGSSRLRTDQAVRADVCRVRRVYRGHGAGHCGGRMAPVVDDHRLGGSPEGRRRLATRHVGDPGRALPPELVRAANAGQRGHRRGVPRVGHIPDLVARSLRRVPLDVAQEVDVAVDAARQVGAEAHARHLCLTSRDRDRDMGCLHRSIRTGDVDDHRAVRLHRGADLERVGPAAAVRARERDRPFIRIDDDVRLVRRPPLQIDVSHPTHVSLFAALADAGTAIVGQDVSRRRRRHDRQRHACQHPLGRYQHGSSLADPCRLRPVLECRTAPTYS